jgi:hypothetical protein
MQLAKALRALRRAIASIMHEEYRKASDANHIADNSNMPIEESPDVEDLLAYCERERSSELNQAIAMVPLYYVCCEFMSLEARDFFVPPHPGMLAWYALPIHHSLHCKTTL